MIWGYAAAFFCAMVNVSGFTWEALGYTSATIIFACKFTYILWKYY